MQATLDRTELKNKNTQPEIRSLYALLRKLETADNKTKNIIENEIVSIGEAAIPELIAQLQHIKGVVRGTIAMVLIRMGENSVAPLVQAAKRNSEFKWMADYLISEIRCPEKVVA